MITAPVAEDDDDGSLTAGDVDDNGSSLLSKITEMEQ